MCMKNVNATILFCSNIETQDNTVNSLIGIYDSIVPIREDNIYYLDNFNVVLSCCAIFDNNFNEKDDCIQLNTDYEFMVWLTHVESGLGISLYKSDLTIKQEDLRTWCKNFYEFKRFLKFQKIEIPKGLGNYAVKFLIRKKEQKIYLGTPKQFIHLLLVKVDNGIIERAGNITLLLFYILLSICFYIVYVQTYVQLLLQSQYHIYINVGYNRMLFLYSHCLCRGLCHNFLDYMIY